MSIKATLSSDGLEEVYTAPTLKEMCLYKCLTNKEILTTEVEVDEDMDGSEKLAWEKFRLKEPMQRELVEALLDAGENFLFALTPKYEPVLAAIRMSQPEHLVKVHVSNTSRLTNNQLEWLISGGNVKSLDIHGCNSLGIGSLGVINKFGMKLEYLRIGDCSRILPYADGFYQRLAILRTPNVKTFIVSKIYCSSANVTNYWRCLLQDFISNLEDLQISRIGWFETLEFLEPARTLSSLTLRNCKVAENANAWASLFKLDKLRFLDVTGSSIKKAVRGNVVQRLLTAMPNLTHLAVDSGLVKDTSIKGQGSMAKRLRFLGIRNINNKDVFEIRKAKLLANDVAHFGTFEGELRMLEYYSNLLNISDYDSDLILELETLLNSMDMMPSCKTVAVIGLLMKIFKNIGADVLHFGVLLHQLKEMLTPDVASKLGNVLVDQCMGTIFACMTTRWSMKISQPVSVMISEGNDVIDIMMNLEGVLRCDHYLTFVPTVMRIAERALTKLTMSVIDDIVMVDFKDLLRKIAQLLKKALDRFPGETNELWCISSVIVVIQRLKWAMVSHESYRVDLMEGFSSLITPLRKLCLTSAPRRAAFHSANGVRILMDFLKEIMDGRLGLADGDSFVLLEISQSILQDTNLELSLSETGRIVSALEKLLLAVHSKLELWKSSRLSSNAVGENTNYLKMQNVCSLLNYLESDPRFDYKTNGAVKEIMMKLK